MQHNNTSETITVAVAKLSPPVTVSLASIGGYQISELVMIITLIYTVVMLFHKIWQIGIDIMDRAERKKNKMFDRRSGDLGGMAGKVDLRREDRRLNE